MSARSHARPRLLEASSYVGRDMPFDNDWRFFRGAGEGYERLGLDDSTWRRVDLPHDWSIEDIPGGVRPGQIGPFDEKAEGTTATGFTVGGEGWYRKHFKVGFSADARIELLFDGAYLETDVWLNGHSLGCNVYGYAPFAFDLTPHLDRAGNNVLAVRVRNFGRNSRWYSGSGLYRQVKLDVLPCGARIARWGVGAWTRRVADGRAEIDVATRIEAVGAGMELVTRLRDSEGSIVTEIASAAGDNVEQTLIACAPRLWSPETPYLYSLESELRCNGKVLDRLTQPFGIRIVTFDVDRGVAINGDPVDLRGSCMHHDNGLLGARAFRDADERRVGLLKARGYNAIRSAHNPSSRSFREACDRLGMLLIEETFDVWHSPKEPHDFSVRFKDHWHDAVRPMVLSARNCASVIMWSIGNEIPYRATDEGVEWEWKLANTVRQLDPTRPVTAGLNGVLGGPMIAKEGTARRGFAGKVDNASTIFLDIPGYNYRLEDIETEHSEHPERLVYASETFARDVYDYWALAKRAPYFLGEFVWTAMDYLGEAGLGASAQLDKTGIPYFFPVFPWVNAWCGDIDLIGHQKAPSLCRDVVWGLSPLEMTVQRPIPDGKVEYIAVWGWSDELQSWSWTGVEGKPVAVRVYSSGDRVELWLNGNRLEERVLTPADKMRVEFKVPFTPGVLEAIAFMDGKEIGRRKLETVGPPKKLRFTVEPGSARCDRQALMYVGIDVVDDQGRILPDEQRRISLSIDGPAELIGFGSANQLATGSFQASEALTYRGRALAILRSQGNPGTIQIDAQADGLQRQRVTICLE